MSAHDHRLARRETEREAGLAYSAGPTVLVVHDLELDLVRIPNGAVDADRLDR